MIRNFIDKYFNRTSAAATSSPSDDETLINEVCVNFAEILEVEDGDIIVSTNGEYFVLATAATGKLLTFEQAKEKAEAAGVIDFAGTVKQVKSNYQNALKDLNIQQ